MQLTKLAVAVRRSLVATGVAWIVGYGAPGFAQTAPAPATPDTTPAGAQSSPTPAKAARTTTDKSDDKKVTELGAVAVPTLVISGQDDQDNGSPEELAALLQHGQAQRIPGNHLSAVGAPLGRAIVQYLEG